jgi:peptide chain release factor subunit 1
MEKFNNEEEENLGIWKIKKIYKKLSSVKGNGTSMISLIIPPGDQLSRVQKMLSDEYGTASNIKSRTNRLSVLSAIVSTQNRLKLYQNIPKNGLILYCGTILDEFGKEKKVTYDIEPFKPINTSLYLCDNKFHTNILLDLTQEEEKFGFIIIDGKGVLIGLLIGNRKEILYKLNVDLPKKHGRGGQSAVRFARLRVEKRNNFLKKVSEVAAQYFIPDGNKLIVSGLIIAGSADFKNNLGLSDFFDNRLKSKILNFVDIAYGAESGFNQAIDACSFFLKDLRFIKEKKLLQSYFDEISKDSGKYIFGIDETIEALQASMVDKLIIWENFPIWRHLLYNSKTKEQFIVFSEEENLVNLEFYENYRNKSDLVLWEKEELIEWIIKNFKSWGANLFFVTDRTPEGSQFIKGFGGLGGILRYSFLSNVAVL